jgi:hypothetical protein
MWWSSAVNFSCFLSRAVRRTPERPRGTRSPLSVGGVCAPLIDHPTVGYFAAPDEQRHLEYKRFVEDLKKVKTALTAS